MKIKTMKIECALFYYIFVFILWNLRAIAQHNVIIDIPIAIDIIQAFVIDKRKPFWILW